MERDKLLKRGKPEQMEQRKNRAIKAGIWYTVGNIFVKGITFITLPLFTILMNAEEYGLYNTFAAYVSILAVIVSLGLPSSVRNARYDMPKEETQYHINATLLILMAFLAFLCSALLFRNFWTNLMGLPALLLLVAVVNSTCTALQSYYNNILTIDFRYQQFLKLSFFYSFASVGLSVLLIYFVFPSRAALGRALGNLIPMVLIACYVLIQIWRNGKIRLHRNYTKYGIRFGLPLIPNDLSSLMLAQFDRIMIYRTIGEAESGLYSFAYNVAVIYQVIANSIENAWTPWMFAQLNKGGHQELKKKIKLYIIILTMGTAMLTLASPEIIMLLSSSSYWESRSVVVPIIFAMYFWAIATIPVGIEFYHKKTGWISVCTFCTAVFNIVLNLIFIPRFGYPAAAYTTLVCYFLYALFHMEAARKLEPVSLLKMPAVLLSILFMIVISGISIAALFRPAVRWGLELALLIGVILAAVKYRTKLCRFAAEFVKKRRNDVE